MAMYELPQYTEYYSCGSLSETQSYLKHVQNFDVTLVVMGIVVELGS